MINARYFKRHPLLIILIIFVGFVSCREKTISFKQTTLSIAPYIDQKAADLKPLTAQIPEDDSSPYTLEIILYKFSSGKETISLGHDGEFTTQSDKMKISLLLKITKEKEFINSYILEIKGNSLEEIGFHLAQKLKDIKSAP